MTWLASEPFLWRLRHPSVRRCPSCRLTWEPRQMIRAQGGVCHDCSDPFDDSARGVVIELEAQAASQERDDEVVEAHALALGLGAELRVEGGGHPHDELSAGVHASNSTAYGIDNDSTAEDTRRMLTSHFGRVDPTWMRVARRSWALETLAGCKIVHADTRITHGPARHAL